jgi:hypothetical protein
MGLAAVGALVAVLRLNAADPPTSLPQAEDPTCREDPRTIDCKRDWIFDRCTTFAIEHEAAFEAIKGCTLETELLIDYDPSLVSMRRTVADGRGQSPVRSDSR